MLREKMDSSNKTNDLIVDKKHLESTLVAFEDFMTKQNQALQTLSEKLTPLYTKMEQYKPPVAPISQRNFKM